MLWLYDYFFPVVWIAFLLYWQFKAVHTKTTQRIEPAASRIFRVLLFLIAITLVATKFIPLRWLYLPLWPSGFWRFWLGAAVTVAGILTGFLGVAIALSQVRGFVAFALIFLAFWLKLRLEEQWMRSQFGETYTTYARKTAALVPYLL